MCSAYVERRLAQRKIAGPWPPNTTFDAMCVCNGIEKMRLACMPCLVRTVLQTDTHSLHALAWHDKLNQQNNFENYIHAMDGMGSGITRATAFCVFA